MTTPNKPVKTLDCPRCAKPQPVIRKMFCYICKVCRLVLTEDPIADDKLVKK